MSMDAELLAIFEHRLARRRKLLPNLKLRYPNDEESKKLAELAGIGDFDGGIQAVILDAHLNFPRYKVTLPLIFIQRRLEPGH
jgi:hypothetical protein